LIKLLLSGKQLLLFIIIAWSLLAFVSYNVLTVEASTDKEKYDYDSYEEYNVIIEPLCNDKGGKLNHGDGYCYFDERDKELQFEKELDNIALGADYTAEEEASWNQKAEEEKAAQEDAICDNEDSRVTNIKLCMSDERAQEVQEREKEEKEMYSSKTFKNLLASKGIDYDDYKNDKLSSEKRDELETEFREDKSDEYAEEINKDNKEDEDKRYVNPDGGAPLYEDELTEEEKGYYEEYKPEKEQKNIEYW
jgi:hypothetical protein